MDKYISNYTGEQIDALLSQIQSNVSQADLDALKAELILRLQGTSTNQDGYKDPIFYKEFVGSATLDDMNTWLNNQFFAIKDGVYYRNGQSGTLTISKDVPQCLININFQGVKLYVFNAPRSFASGTFEQIAFGVRPISDGGGITWGSDICRRHSTYDFTTKKATWTAWEKINSDVDKTYVDKNIELLAKQRTSFVTPCFSDCDTTHEAKCNSITLAGDELGFGFKSIFSVTIKIAENLSLLNHTPTYLHIKDLFGNSIGVSMNGVKQMQNLGKYATWFFDSVINTSGGPIVLSLHTTNVASSASDSNHVRIIAHVNQSKGMKACGVTDENGTYHTNWTPALGINVVNLAAIYPQIKELQKYRMAYATSELPDISTTGHKANVKEIRINQNVMGISLVNSVSIMVASDSAYSGALELRVYDINDNLIATSNNTVNLSQNLGKYVTWYFTPFQLNTDAIYKFSVWHSGTSQVMRIHVAGGKSEGVTCFDQNNSPHTDYCPAFGINISAIFADDLRKNIKEVNLALGKEISTKADKTYVDNKFSQVDNATNLSTKDMQYMGVAFDRNGYNNGTYDTSVDVPNLSVGDTFDYIEGYDSRGNISDAITIYSGETIVTSANGATAILINYSPGIMQVLAKSREDGICIYKCEQSSSEIYLYGYGAEYQIYKNPYVLKLNDLYKKVNEISSNYVDASTFISATNDLDTRKADKTDIASKLNTKVDKVSNKGLSTNDYTTEEKNLVATIPSKVDKVSGKGLSSNDFIDKYKFATQTLDEILEKKGETQTVVDITSNFCLGTFGEKESLLNVGAEIPFANHYTFRHKVDKIDGNNQEYVELGCNTYYVDYYTGGSNLKELFIRVPIDEHSYILLHCRQYGDGHGYRWIVKKKIYGNDDVHDTTKIPYLFSPLKYTDDEVKKLQSTITALEARIAALEAK